MGTSEITQVRIGNQQVGLVGLKEAIEELVQTMGQAPDEALAQALVNKVSKQNYIPEAMRSDYGQALVREFKKDLGLPVEEAAPKGLTIKVLGQGCNNCRALTQRIMEVMNELNLAADLEHVTDIKKIASYRVMGSPALIINGKLLSVGTVPGKKQLIEWLRQVGT